MNKPNREIKLVDNWKVLHKSYTIILSVLATIIGLLEVILPQMGILQPILDPVTYGTIMFIMTVSIAIGRYLKQDSVEKVIVEGKTNVDKH